MAGIATGERRLAGIIKLDGRFRAAGAVDRVSRRDPFLRMADFAANDRSTLELDLRSRRRESRRQRQQSFAGGHRRPAKDPG